MLWKLSLLSSILVALSIGMLVAAGENGTDENNKSSAQLSVTDAQKRLVGGNKRFVAGKTQHPHEMINWRQRLIGAQRPFATVLGCSDSRVPPELLFDQGFGDLFVIRIAGNVIDSDVTGSIEYGVDHLDTKLVVVMGHESCGAVTASLASMVQLESEPMEIQSLLHRIEPAIHELDRALPRHQLIAAAVEANVRQSVALLKKTPDLQKAIRDHGVKVVGAVYELSTGEVRFLDPQPADAAKSVHPKSK